jgi:hypothetical protein
VFLYQVRGGFEDLVTLVVTETVVNAFEVIQVEDDEGEVPAFEP